MKRTARNVVTTHKARHSIFEKTLSLLLSVILLLSLGTFAVSAEAESLDGISGPVKTSPTENVGVLANEGVLENTAVQMTEVVELREENVKHFDNGDGTYSVFTYNEAVHRKDANGVWQDIDNTLTRRLHSATKKERFATSDGRIGFSTQYEPGEELFVIEENGYRIAMTFLVEEQKTLLTRLGVLNLFSSNTPIILNGNKRNADAVYTTVEEATRIDTQSRISYPNVAQGTDLEYTLQGNRVKENILVNSRRESYSYRFVLLAEGLTVAVNENGSISFADTNDETVRYTIPAPYMVDANGAVSHAVTYTIQDVGESTYTIVVTADASWINAEGRAFPVAIDPTVIPEYASEDTYISDMSNSAKSTVFGADEEMWIAEDTTVFIKNQLPNFPSGTVIQRARMYVDYFYAGIEGTANVGVYEVLYPWSEQALTWNLANRNPNLGISTTQYTSFSLTLSVDDSDVPTESQHVILDITSLASSWCAGTTSNYGIALKYLSGDCFEFGISSYESGFLFPQTEYRYSYSLPTGIYALRNKATGKYLTVTSENPQDTNTVALQSYATSPSVAFNANALFKIYASSSSSHVVRSMLNNAVTLTYSASNGFGIKKISKTNSEVASPDKIGISYTVWTTEEGFVLTVNGQALNLDSVANTSHKFWVLEQYFPNGNHTTRVDMHAEGVFESGETVTLSPEVISTTVTAANYEVEVAIPTDSATHASCTWNSATNTAELLLKEEGSFNVELRLTNGYGSTYQTVTLSYEVLPNVCYIRNKAGINVGSPYFNSANWHGISNTTFLQTADTLPSHGDDITLGNFEGATYQQWIIELLADGYYEIRYNDRNTNRTDDLMMIYESEKLIIKQRSDARLQKQKWSITRDDETGHYIMSPKNNTSVCLYSNEVGVSFQSYVDDDNTQDLWVIAKIGYASDVIPETQQTNRWCWAATARMFAKHYYPNLQTTQQEVVEIVHIDDPNNGGNWLEILAAIDVYIPNPDFSVVYHPDRIYSSDTLKNFLDHGHVVYIGIMQFNTEHGQLEPGKEHAFLVYGYVSINGELRFLVRDPHPQGGFTDVGTPIGNPTSYMRSYENLCFSHQVSEDEFPHGTYIWNGVLACSTSYANATKRTLYPELEQYYANEH